MNFSCYQGNNEEANSRASRRGDRQTDRQRSCTAAQPRVQPSLAVVTQSLPEESLASLSCPHPTARVRHPPISPVLTPVSSRLEPHPEGSILHPRPFHCPFHIFTCLILHPAAHSLHPASPLLYPFTPSPTFHTLQPALHPEPALAPYPAERQLDNVGSVAGDYPWEEEEEKEEGQKR